MADDAVAQFTAFTGADAERATQYLNVTDNNVEQAVSLFFESGGGDLGGALPSESSHAPTGASSGQAIPVDDEDIETPAAAVADTNAVEDDEAIARRIQDEMYAAAGTGALQDDVDPDTGIRAPMARTTETLADPVGHWQDDPEDVMAAVREQMRTRQARRQQGRPGIFNQQGDPSSGSIWASEQDSAIRQENLARATGGASENSSKSNMLAEMYRPPFELISDARTWEGVRAIGKEDEKWILINIQDPNIFDCQVLNRDIWKNPQIQETVKEHFVFKQYTKSDPQASQYVRYYFQSVDSEDAYPHIAIVDPRTGEQVKVWSGSPAPKAMDFLMQLHEFLDRYSLRADARNPVAKRKAERKKEKDPGKMTEEEQLEMAMQNSLGAPRKGSGPREDDPDVLTRSQLDANGEAANGHAGAPPATESPFDSISSTAPHIEPDAQAPDQTRIQFRHPGGRVIRRFLMSDKVERIYEWLKAEPLPDMTGKEFQLNAMGQDLLGPVEEGKTIGDAGLRNGTVMIEFGA